MSDATATPDTIAHFRVKVGGVWLHAVGVGDVDAVRKQLAYADDVWKRVDVELVVAKPIDTWYGPFPKGRPGHFKQWLVEVDD